MYIELKDRLKYVSKHGEFMKDQIQVALIQQIFT